MSGFVSLWNSVEVDCDYDEVNYVTIRQLNRRDWDWNFKRILEQ